MLESGDGEPREAVLLCHPHPLYGGTMRNKVVHRIARGLGRTGAAVLRFNFRGVGLSEGAFDDGRGELDDARASMEWLRARFPETPYSIAGFSFGSRIALRLACELGTVARVIGVGVPTARTHAQPRGHDHQQCRCPGPEPPAAVCQTNLPHAFPT